MAKRSRSKKSAGTKRKSAKVRRRTWDPVEVAEKLAPAVATMIGLDVLGLNEEQYAELLRDVLVGLMGDRVTKPKAETLVNAIKRNENRIMPVIAAKLLEIIPEGQLTPDQLDFVINYIGPMAIAWASRIYREAKRLGMDLGPVQAGWEEAWRLRGDPGPVGFCPNCGFRSVAPDGVCMVCGKVLNEEELRKAVDFEAKFEEFLEAAECKELREALTAGFLYVSHWGASTKRETKWDIEIFLKRKEKEKLREAISRRCNGGMKEVLKKILAPSQGSSR